MALGLAHDVGIDRTFVDEEIVIALPPKKRKHPSSLYEQVKVVLRDKIEPVPHCGPCKRTREGMDDFSAKEVCESYSSDIGFGRNADPRRCKACYLKDHAVTANQLEAVLATTFGDRHGRGVLKALGKDFMEKELNAHPLGLPNKGSTGHKADYKVALYRNDPTNFKRPLRVDDKGQGNKEYKHGFAYMGFRFV
jgi:hypothetical protein